MTTTTIKTADLTGAALDYAVAMAGAWKHAHEHFPTMTLDSTFKGYRAFRFEGGRVVCQLVPNNPFRQDHVIYEPSSTWEIAGLIIERELISTNHMQGRAEQFRWQALIPGRDKNGLAETRDCYGPTLLTAAMRCYVASKLGGTVDIPQELSP
ncbi:phage protein NinX family protein [Comamonas sp. MYb396]|uniref:phage protein NinX family protein n=1 Tax=Comamonas sp. MYb396 TaxID=2745302 RepID=UPI003098D74B